MTSQSHQGSHNCIVAFFSGTYLLSNVLSYISNRINWSDLLNFENYNLLQSLKIRLGNKNYITFYRALYIFMYIFKHFCEKIIYIYFFFNLFFLSTLSILVFFILFLFF